MSFFLETPPRLRKLPVWEQRNIFFNTVFSMRLLRLYDDCLSPRNCSCTKRRSVRRLRCRREMLVKFGGSLCSESIVITGKVALWPNLGTICQCQGRILAAYTIESSGYRDTRNLLDDVRVRNVSSWAVHPVSLILIVHVCMYRRLQ